MYEIGYVCFSRLSWFGTESRTGRRQHSPRPLPKTALTLSAATRFLLPSINRQKKKINLHPHNSISNGLSMALRLKPRALLRIEPACEKHRIGQMMFLLAFPALREAESLRRGRRCLHGGWRQRKNK